MIIDAIVPNMNWAIAPVTTAINLVRDFRSYTEIIEQNQELRFELQRMKSWKKPRSGWNKKMRLLELNNLA